MSYKIISANRTKENINDTISEIFVDGFFRWLKYFSKDKEKLKRAFAHMFNLEVFYAAMDGETVAGIAVLNDGTSPTVILNRKELQKHLGFVMGGITYKMLTREFVEKQYPFALKEREASIEFVATALPYRGKGVASAIIENFTKQPQYDSYVLEVADTNENAVQLYEKLGFHEFMRIEEKYKKQSGLNFYLYMRCEKEGDYR